MPKFAPFVHLHVHSSHSILASTARMEALIGRAKKHRMPALALTDQGNLFAAVAFYQKSLKAGVKPIMGSQVYVVPDRREMDNRPDRENRDQLILLARNQVGWKSLMKIVSVGYLEGSHGKPRIDREVLEANAEGLIALSAGPKGDVGRFLAAGDMEAAREAATYWKDLYGDTEGAPNFFLEVQRHGLEDEEFLVRATAQLAHDLHIPLVASNDVHYMDPSDQAAHDAYVCVGESRTIYEENRHTFNSRYGFTSPEEMVRLFADLPEAIENTITISRRCNLLLRLGSPMLPDYEVPPGENLESWLENQSEQGLVRRLEKLVYPRFPEEEHEKLRKEYFARLEMELGIINQMGFPGYFLIVSDFIIWAKERGIPVGPGRGSGAGSVVAWALDITDLDPIRYSLLFERFLNPERVSMPDFDVDFCMDRREEVIEYVQQKYGADRVAQIITFGTMQAKAVVRDVGRVLELPFFQVDGIAKLIPNVLGIKLQEALDQEERLKALVDDDPDVAHLVDLGLKLEGLHRNAGTHAAGVVISNGPLTDTVPLYKDPRSEMPVTQFNMKDVEKAGLVKFDFLGLKTLTVIQTAVDLVNAGRIKSGEEPVDILTIDLEDEASYQLLKEGRTQGVFQLESSGMREILKKLAPSTFEDIIALVALYRPGPLGSGMVDTFIDGKHGRIEVEYPLPQLEPILQPTYGVILYQEQVMQIAQVLANYTLGGADLLRRAMGKKKPEEMAQQRDLFMNGAAENKLDPEKAKHIFDLMEHFAGYGFNKSHSAAYALVAYQTAWLKAHYPKEFMAATMTCDMLNTDKVVRFVTDCKSAEIPVLPPDVNRSRTEFTVEGDGVRFGMGAVKNVGEGAVDAIVKAREEGGPFSGLFDLCRRTDAHKLNRRVVENLIKSGAMDAFNDGNRAQLMAALPQAMGQGGKKQEEEELGYMDLFGDLEEEAGEEGGESLPETAPWNDGEMLGHEKEALGFFITGHPMQKYEEELTSYGLEENTETLFEKFGGEKGAAAAAAKKAAEEAAEKEGGKRKWRRNDSNKGFIKLAGMIAAKKILRTKKGDRMAFLTIEDLHGQMEVVMFPNAFAGGKQFLDSEDPVVVEGIVEPDEENPKFMAESLTDIDGLREKVAREVRVEATPLAFSGEEFDQVTAILNEFRVPPDQMGCRVIFKLRMTDGIAHVALGRSWQVVPAEALLNRFREVFGDQSVGFSARGTTKNVG